MALSASDEASRLAAVQALAWPHESADACLDDIAALAAGMFSAPMSFIALAEAKRLVAIAAHGAPRTTASREESFCTHAIAANDIMVVEDAAADPRFAANAFVAGAPFLRFYAAVPLRSASGHALGTLCLIDVVPRAFDQVQRAQLARLGAITERRLRHRFVREQLTRSDDARAAAEARLAAVLREAGGAFAACDRVAFHLEGRARALVTRIERALERAEVRASAETTAMRDLIEELAAVARRDRLGPSGAAAFAPGALVRELGQAAAADLRRYGVALEIVDETDGAEIVADQWRFEELIEGLLGACGPHAKGDVQIDARFAQARNGRACFQLRFSAAAGALSRIGGRNRELVDAMGGAWEAGRDAATLTITLPARLYTQPAPRPAPETNVLPFPNARRDAR